MADNHLGSCCCLFIYFFLLRSWCFAFLVSKLLLYCTIIILAIILLYCAAIIIPSKLIRSPSACWFCYIIGQPTTWVVTFDLQTILCFCCNTCANFAVSPIFWYYLSSFCCILYCVCHLNRLFVYSTCVNFLLRYFWYRTAIIIFINFPVMLLHCWIFTCINPQFI